MFLVMLGPDRLAPSLGAIALTADVPSSIHKHPTKPAGRKSLAETWLHRDPLATLGTSPRDYRAAALGLHTRAKSVRLRAMTAVRLKCALRHEKIAAPDSYIRWRTNVEYK